MSDHPPWSGLWLRGLLGGVLMGLANLVPGISGGTMLLAMGIYPAFVHALADLSTGRMNPRGLALLTAVAVGAGLSILLLAGLLRDLVTDHRWIMYSLFIGLTLGGVPVILRLIGRLGTASMAGLGVGFVGMVALAVVQGLGIVGGAEGGGALMMGLAGLAAASAMILPGVSGSYLLLVMGMYIPVLEGVDALKSGLQAMDPALLMTPLFEVVLPVGVGVVIGVVGVSNLLRWLLARHEQATLGVLLGLLLGSVFGLYPFQEAIPPAPQSVIKGVVVTEENWEQIDPEDWPVTFYLPDAVQVVGSLGLMVVGFGITSAVARLGRDPEEGPTPDPPAAG